MKIDKYTWGLPTDYTPTFNIDKNNHTLPINQFSTCFFYAALRFYADLEKCGYMPSTNSFLQIHLNQNVE